MIEMSVTTKINGQVISRVDVQDPIHTTRVRMQWLDRLKFLFSPGEFSVSLDANGDAISAIMTGLSTYVPPEPGPSLPMSMNDQATCQP
jgi:hypothetical protein